MKTRYKARKNNSKYLLHLDRIRMRLGGMHYFDITIRSFRYIRSTRSCHFFESYPESSPARNDSQMYAHILHTQQSRHS